MYYIHLNRHHGFSLVYNHEHKRFDERIVVTHVQGELEVIDTIGEQHLFDTKEEATSVFEEARDLVKHEKDYELTLKTV